MCDFGLPAKSIPNGGLEQALHEGPMFVPWAYCTDGIDDIADPQMCQSGKLSFDQKQDVCVHSHVRA